MSTVSSGSSVTRRQLERAEEGLRLYRAVRQARETAINIMMANGGTNALAKTREDEKWKIIADSAVEELGEAVEKMRLGMPENATDVSSARMLHG
jgi:hypothetical protein